MRPPQADTGKNSMRRSYFILYFIFSIALLMPLNAFADKKVNSAEIVRKARAAFAGVNDYTCILHRKDVVNGSYTEHSKLFFKFRNPASFYMKSLKYKYEAIYVLGKYNNKMVIHGGYLLNYARVSVSPNMVLKYSRHTMPEADIGHIMSIVDANFSKAVKDKDASIVYEQEEKLDSAKTWRFKAVFPRGRDYYGHIIIVNIDKALHLPIKISVWGWEGEFLEEYYYEGLKINIGLTEEDFDVNNKHYMFNAGAGLIWKQ
jgi:hypothetical protein